MNAISSSVICSQTSSLITSRSCSRATEATAAAKAGDLGFILHSRHQYHWHTGYVPPQTVHAPHMGAFIARTLGPRDPAVPAFINIGQRLDLGFDGQSAILGRKAKRGFYLYEEKEGKKGDKRVDPAVYKLLGWKPADAVNTQEIVDRCWLQMLNETARCMEEGIITNPADVDIGVIFGVGFPPFRGGLLREADRHGLRWVVDRLDGFAERYGERLRPAALLREMADRGATFYK